MKTMHPFRTINYFLCILFLCGCLSCKKQDASLNNIVFSFNDSLPATCTKAHVSYDFMQTSSCKFQFDRTGQFASGEAADITLYAASCDLVTAPLPCQTKFFTVVISINSHPGQTILYDYDALSGPANTQGDLTLTITKRENNRIKGTITGTIYGAEAGRNPVASSKLNCSFDLAIPLVN